MTIDIVLIVSAVRIIDILGVALNFDLEHLAALLYSVVPEVVLRKRFGVPRDPFIDLFIIHTAHRSEERVAGVPLAFNNYLIRTNLHLSMPRSSSHFHQGS